MAVSVPTVLLPVCQYCSQPTKPWDITAMPGGVLQCRKCAEWHERAIADYSQHPQWECGECQVKFADTGHGQFTRVFLYPKDAAYQALCETCAGRYEQKRRDLFKGTKYGHLRNLTR